MILLSSSDSDIRKAAKLLKEGKLVAFPTETVYGLGADAFNTHALARVFEAKGRPRFDPLIIHIAESAALDRIVRLDTLGREKRALLDKLSASFWPGPLTLILPKRDEVPDLATAGLSTAAVRFPSHKTAQSLIRLSTGAIAAPSANPFGRLSPTRAEHVIAGLGERIDCIIDGGPSQVGVESTVLDLSSGPPRILRYGGIPREALEVVMGPVGDMSTTAAGPDVKRERDTVAVGEIKREQDIAANGEIIRDRDTAAVGEIIRDRDTSGLLSPGSLRGHYAPGTPLILHDPEELAVLRSTDGEGYLFFSGDSRDSWLRKNPGASELFALSETGSTLEAAANLFEYLHRLDQLGLIAIHAETLPQEGLGAAVNDRLCRASAGSRK